MTITTGRTILVVEDVDEISSQMNRLLTKRGHRVLQASNAEEAIRIAEANRPTIILTDLDLPTFDTLMKLVEEHKDLRNLLVAIIDIDTPKVSDGRLKVLADFDSLDDLIDSTQSQSGHQA